MNTAEKQSLVKAMIGDADIDEALISAYLKIAEERILNRCYPFGCPEGTTCPQRYEMLQVEITVYLWNKRGAEGERVHDENGVKRSYGHPDIPADMLATVTPTGSVY